ncbi:MAG: helix-turn-helix domain-containing protein [Pyrinomonadaceae bacterium]
MSSSLGEKLRQAREERGISISEVAEQTRISPLYLEAIDADNYKTLPGGIFNKGFVRSYAKYVGVDEQEALQDYMRLMAEHEAKEDDKYKAYRPEVLTDDRAVSSILPTVIFAAVILGLMTAGILFLVSYTQDRQSQPPVVTNTNNASPSNSSTNPINVEPASQTPTMGALMVEFKTNGEGISLSSVSDGSVNVALVTADKPAVFEPKQQLKLSYSKSLARSAQLSINGKSITLPSAPANPKRAVIEFDINPENLSGVWQSGAISFGASDTSVPAANTTPAQPGVPATIRPTPKPAANVPPASANTRPANSKPAATPIVVGKPAANSAPRPN